MARAPTAGRWRTDPRCASVMPNNAVSEPEKNALSTTSTDNAPRKA